MLKKKVKIIVMLILLFVAAMVGYHGYCSFLIEEGANINIQNKEGKAAYDTAVKLGDEEDDFSIWYSELWAEYLEPIMTEEESNLLESIDWDEELRPYMEYDWIGDERIEKDILYINSLVMQLADLNLDGQLEMLVSEYCDRMAEDYTYVFTIQEGEVVYCGKIIASVQFTENEFFGDLEYLPSYYIDAYQNADGEFRYLSCDDFLMAAHGEYWIYESTFDGTGISGNLAYMIDFAEESDGTKQCRYALGDKLGDNYLDYYENYNENAVVDDEAYSDFCGVMEAYMQGYQRVDISFTVSEYRVPAASGALSSEQQEIVRKNIVAGFARALGYLDKE